MLMELVSILLGIVLLGAIDYGSGAIRLSGIMFLIYLLSMLIILALTAPVLFRGGIWNDFLRAWKLLKRSYTCHLSEIRRSLDVVEMLQKQLIYAGIISMLLSFIHVLGNMSDLASLGPNVAVAILTMLYAVIFEMLLLPLQIEAKRRIIDYMEVDTDAEMRADIETTARAAGKEDAAAGKETDETKDGQT